MIKYQHLMFSVVVRSSLKHIWVKISMVTKYDVISSRWSSHFWVKVHVFSTFFNNKSNSGGWNHANCLSVIFHVKHKKSLFLAVLTWFLILGKIQEGDHCWWRSRPPAAPLPIKYTLSCQGDQRLSTEGKTFRNAAKNQKLPRWGMNLGALVK